MPSSFALLADRVLRSEACGYFERHTWATFSLTFVLAWVLCYLRIPSIRRARQALLFLAAGVSAFVVWVSLHYMGFDKFQDQGEAHVASVSWLIWRGQELYPAWDAVEDYANFYGPISYLIPAISAKLMGPSFWSVKLPSVLAGLAAPIAVYFALRAERTRSTSLVWASLAAWSGLYFDAATYWNRPDPLILLSVALGVLASVRGDRGLAIAGTGVLLGIAANLKVQAIVGFLPPLAWIVSRFGIRAVFSVGAIALFTGILPFLLLPSASFSSYFSLLPRAADQGRPWSEVYRFYLPAAAFFALPALLDRALTRKPPILVLVAIGISGVLCAIVAAKPGAGMYQLLPLIPSCFVASGRVLDQWLQGSARIPRWARATTLGFALALAALALPSQYRAGKAMHGNAKLPVVADLDQISEKVVGKRVAIGWGDNSQGDQLHLSFYRPYFIWKGNPYFLDLGIRMEMDFMRRPVNPLTADLFRNCAVEVWLIPRGERPFEFLSWYTGGKVYPQWFLDAFHQAYQRTGESRFYDLWECRSGSGAS